MDYQINSLVVEILQARKLLSTVIVSLRHCNSDSNRQTIQTAADAALYDSPTKPAASRHQHHHDTATSLLQQRHQHTLHSSVVVVLLLVLLFLLPLSVPAAPATANTLQQQTEQGAAGGRDDCQTHQTTRDKEALEHNNRAYIYGTQTHRRRWQSNEGCARLQLFGCFWLPFLSW